MWRLNFTKKRVQATCKWPWGASLDRWPFRVKFNKRKVWNKIAYSKNTASAKSIYTHKKRMTEKIYNAYDFIIHIHTHTYINTYIYTHTHTHIYIYIYIYIYISGWIFQKVLAEIVQKDLILSQKALISNRRNLGLFAPTSMRFPSKDSKWKDLSF